MKHKGKVRKQYLIFAGVILLLIVLLIVSLTSGKRKKYNGEKVTIDYEHTITDDQTPDLTPEALADEPDPYSVLDMESGIDSPQESAPISSVPTAEPRSSAGHESQNDNILVDVIPDDDDEEQMSVNDTRASILSLYVCGYEDNMFSAIMTSSMMSEFNKHLDEEPYKTLYGNAYIADLQTDGNTFSFSVQDGTVYKFEIQYDGELVSGLRYIK